MDLTANQQR